MATFEDLTAYEYGDLAPRWTSALNVGWLGSRGEFPTGPVDERLIPALTRLAYTHEVNVTRGGHDCPFCGLETPFLVPVPGIQGARAAFGHSEIHIEGSDGVTYAVPTLIVHYIEAHRYQPPTQFVEAALWVDQRTSRELRD